MPSEIIQFDEFHLDLGRYQLRRGDRVIKLERNPMELLILLAQNQGRLVTREEIIQRLWGDSVFVDTRHGINTAVHKLRTGLKDDAERPKILETVFGKGYRLVSQGTSETPPLTRDVRYEGGTSTNAVGCAGLIDSLAILPLVNITGLEETEYFADGLTELIIGSLSQLLQIRVMACSTVFRYKGRDIDPCAAGRELNVRVVMVGRLLKHDDCVKLHVELVNVEDGAQVWNVTYDRNLSNMFDMQNQIAADISEKLRVHLTVDQKTRLAKTDTQDGQAYQRYLMGRFHLARRTEASLQRSIVCFQQAVDQDPSYSLAHAGLAEAYLSAEYCSWLPPAIALAKEETAVQKAIELDDSSCEAHTALAIIQTFHHWDTRAGEKEFLHALELNPNCSNAWHRYGVPYLTSVRRFDEAEVALKRALEMDPLSLLVNAHVGLVLTYQRRFRQAEQQFFKTLEMDPNFPEAHSFMGLMYWWSDKLEEACDHVRQSIALSDGNLRMRCVLAGLRARLGQQAEAQAELKTFLHMAEERYVSPVLLSLVYLGLGRTEEAFHELEKAARERSPLLPVLNAWPTLDGLNSNSRFKKLLLPFLR